MEDLESPRWIGQVDPEPTDAICRPAKSRLIGKFADAFLDMSKDQRMQAEIELPGVTNASRYQYAFRRLRMIEELKYHRRVFYAPLRWTADVEDTGSEYRITLHSGSDYNKGRYERPWTVVVHHTQWTSKGRNLFLRDFRTAINLAPKKEPWVFALADQSPNHPAEIHVSVRQQIAFMPLDEDRAPA